MALHWNIAECKDVELLKSDAEWHITNALIWATMSTGLNEITEENLTEFYARLHVWEKIVGPLTWGTNEETGKPEERFIEVEDLRKRIGLHTNASRETRAEWRKRLSEYFDRQLNDCKRVAERSLAKEAA
jgi:hypothetical protein